MKKLIIFLLFSVSIFNSYSAATFNVTFVDQQKNWPNAAQTAFNYAVSIWAAGLTSSVTIEIEAHFDKLGQNTLGEARPETHVANFGSLSPKYVSGVFYHIALANKLNGSDRKTGVPDILCWFSSEMTWYYGTDGSPPNNQVDFVSVVLHELGHGLGFGGGCLELDPPGSQQLLCIKQPNTFDRNLCDNTGTKYAFDPMTSSLEQYMQSDNVWWDGAAAVSNNNGVRPKIYAPNPWQQGRSLGHLDQTVFTQGPHTLMTPKFYRGYAAHDQGSITMSIMNDIGWDATVSIDEVTSINRVKVFPNPSTDVININFGNQIPIKVSITSIDGTLIKTIIPNDYYLEFELNDLENGVYFLTSEFDNKSITNNKIIKL